MTESKPSGSVRCERSGAVARIVLDAPERHNAVEAADVGAFLAHLDDIEADPAVRVLVVTGSGNRTFCAGASLPQMESGAMSADVFETLTDRLASVGLPTVCALNGSAFGGGAELALCCDFRIGVRGSRMFVPAARLGVCYPLGGLRRYVERLGVSASKELLIAGAEWDAEEMLRRGFLTRLVAPESLVNETDALVTRLADGAPLAVRTMKHLLDGLAGGELDADRAATRMRHVNASEDAAEGLRAAVEGRAPNFKGR